MVKKLFVMAGWILVTSLIARGDALDNWTKVSVSPYPDYTQIIYANGTFVAIADPDWGSYITMQYTNGISISPDGTRWTHLQTGDAPSGLVYGNGVFVCSYPGADEDGDDGGVITAVLPSNLITTNTYAPYNYTWYAEGGQNGVAYGKSTFVAVGYSFYLGGVGTINNSTDGTNWNSCSISSSNVFLDGVAFGNNKFVAVGGYPYGSSETNSHVFTSTDGTNWSLVPTLFTKNLPWLTGVSFVNGTFYATPSVPYGSTNYPTNAYFSVSGSGWTQITPPYPSLYVTGTYSNGLYISVHPGYPLATSPDGTNWTVRNTGITNILTGIAYGNNCFVLCTADGSFFRSASTTPSLQSSKFTRQGFQLSVTGGIGPKYQIQASSDLVNWTNLATLTNIESSNQFLDTTASNFARRYYRTLSQ